MPEPRAPLADLLRAWRLRRGRLRRAERATRPELLALQRERIARLLETAARRSPYYRERWGGRIPQPEDLPEIEPLARADLIRHYDDLLTDRSLDRRTLQAWLASPARRPCVVLASSGTTGEPVVVPYTRREWCEGLAYVLRGESRRSPGLLRSFLDARRLATVTTRNPIHASTRIAAGLGALPLARLHLPAAAALREQTAALERFRPTMLSGYPSAIGRLARAQLEGALAIAPRVVLAGGETVPAGLRERARAAWGAELFECYGLTETLLVAWECREHRGMHIDEDAVLIEVVAGGILVTGLYNLTLPLIRYRVGDILRIDDAPCPCGVPFARIVAVEGRREEILLLRRSAEETVEVLPSVVESPLEADPGVRRFQIREEGGALRVLVEPAGAPGDLASRLERAITGALAPHGVPAAAITVEVVAGIDEPLGGTEKRPRVLKG